jgi:hypothetical protein
MADPIKNNSAMMQTVGKIMGLEKSQREMLSQPQPVIGGENILINGGFDFAQRQVPATLTTIADNAKGPDRWRSTRENAALQYQRVDALAETGIVSRYYGKYRKITNAGKIHIGQTVRGVDTAALRGKTVTFQIFMSSNAARTMRMGIIQLQNAGTMDSSPATLVTAFGADGTDPTLGANLAVVTVESKSVTTAWQLFKVSATIPSDCKNMMMAIWSDSDFAVSDEINIAQADAFVGVASRLWSPRKYMADLALAKKEYRKSIGIDSAPGSGGQNGYANWLSNSTSQVRGYISFDTMHRAPTVTPYSFNGTINKISNLAGADIGTTVTALVTTAEGMGVLSDSGAGLTAATLYLFHYTADADDI